MESQDILASKAYKRAEANLRNKLKPVFLKHYSHYLAPGYNLHNESSMEDINLENNVEQYQDFPYHCDLPKPLLPPAKLPRTVISEGDPALELLNVKLCMNGDIKRMQHYHNKHKKKFGNIYKKDVKWTATKNAITAKVPKYLADIAEVIDMDPDPYFKGAYNWYYTGGSLDTLQINGLKILLFPYMGELVAAPMTTTEGLLWKPVLQNATKCNINDSLYELRHSMIGNTCRVLARHKHYCTFYSLSECDSKCSLDDIHQRPSKVPYVSADLSSNDADQYCTVNAERLVTLWDIRKMKHISSNIVPQSKVLDDSWGSVKFQHMDPNIILYTDRCCLHHLDVRIPFDRPALTLCPKLYLEKCEGLSLDAASRHNSCRYLGTYHNLLMCDNRSPKECVQQKWTHQFKSTPLMACVTNREDKEFIVLSSQVAGESTIIVNTWTSDETSHSFNFPFTPPSIMETLNESQMQGMCLNPYLRSRFALCNTGCTFLTNATGDIFLFLQNSVGDIYYQCINHDAALDKYSSINCKSYCILNSWENAVATHTDTVVPLTISDKSNMQHVYENFTNKKLRLRHKEDQANDYFDPSWKQSLEQLGSYVDILAPELLAVWEVCEEVPLPLSAAPHQKVLSWLESADTKELVLSQEEPEDMLTPVNTQELLSVSQEHDITCLDDSNILQQLLLPKVKSRPVKKKRRVQK